jgi:autotransporter-associated beta strand protein
LSARAGTTWDGGGSNNRWNTSGNWNPNGVPTFNSSTDLTFAGSIRLAPDLNGNRTINSLTFAAGAGAFSITGDNGPNDETLTFTGTGAGVNQLAANNQEFLVNRINWGAAATLAVTGAGDLTFGDGSAAAGRFFGSGALKKTGTGGALVLAADNSGWSGGLTVSAGVVEARNSGSALGTGAVSVASGATLRLGTGGLDFANNLTVAGTLANTASSGTNVVSGTVAASGAVTLDVAGGGTLDLAGVVSGTASLTKTGAGALRLSAGGGNTFTGDFTTSAGTVTAAADGVFSATGILAIASGATVELGATAQDIGQLSGDGALDFGTGGALTLTAGTSAFAGSFAGTGTLVLGAGATFQLGADFSATGLSLVLAGGTLALNGHALALGALSITGDSLLDFGGTASASFTTISFVDSATLLQVANWTEDDAFSTAAFPGVTPDVAGSGPAGQVRFDGFPSDAGAWSSYDDRVRPIPEPRAFGAAVLALAGAVLLWRRRLGPCTRRAVTCGGERDDRRESR